MFEPDSTSRRQTRPRSQNRARSIRQATLLVTFTLASGPLTRSTAWSAPHGCISVSDNYSLDADSARRSLGARVNHNTPCTFFFASGDTFSGSGEFRISCESGGEVTDSLEQKQQVQVPIPQPCAVGAKVTVYAGHLGNGGAVVAGSPS